MSTPYVNVCYCIEEKEKSLMDDFEITNPYLLKLIEERIQLSLQALEICTEAEGELGPDALRFMKESRGWTQIAQIVKDNYETYIKKDKKGSIKGE